MVFNVDNWLNNILEKLKEAFAERLLFAGLQGSFNRGEATPQSDIDLVVILDVVKFDDLKKYRHIIDSMPHKEKACGFISGSQELENWTKADLFQFFYDTRALFGNLSDIIIPPSSEDIQNSIKVSSENLYHSAVHSFLHSDDYKSDLQNLYKMTFFILQAKYFVENNIYIQTKNELLEKLTGQDKEILNVCINKKKIENQNSTDLERLYNLLIGWCSNNLLQA